MRITIHVDPEENLREWRQWIDVQCQPNRFDGNIILDGYLYEAQLEGFEFERPRMPNWISKSSIPMPVPDPVLRVTLNVHPTGRQIRIPAHMQSGGMIGQGAMRHIMNANPVRGLAPGYPSIKSGVLRLSIKPNILDKRDEWKEKVPQHDTDAPPVAGIDL